MSQNYSTLDAFELEVFCSTRMFVCHDPSFFSITLITHILHNFYYGECFIALCIRGIWDMWSGKLMKTEQEIKKDNKKYAGSFGYLCCVFLLLLKKKINIDFCVLHFPKPFFCMFEKF